MGRPARIRRLRTPPYRSVVLGPKGLSAEQTFNEFVTGQAKMLSYITQEARQGPDTEGSVARNRDVVLATFESGQSEVAPGLAGHPITQIGQGFREVVTGDVPRKPQALMTSSRTKWSRMTFGALPSSKWQ
jgi:hypothetical protein